MGQGQFAEPEDAREHVAEVVCQPPGEGRGLLHVLLADAARQLLSPAVEISAVGEVTGDHLRDQDQGALFRGRPVGARRIADPQQPATAAGGRHGDDQERVGCARERHRVGGGANARQQLGIAFPRADIGKRAGVGMVQHQRQSALEVGHSGGADRVRRSQFAGHRVQPGGGGGTRQQSMREIDGIPAAVWRTVACLRTFHIGAPTNGVSESQGRGEFSSDHKL